MKKSTQETIKESNIGLILKNIKENIYLSRIDLSKKTKLSRSAISNLVNFLIGEKIVFEGNKINSEQGKKPIELIFNKDLYYIIAINIGTDNITVAIANLLGEIIYISKKKNQPLNDKDHIIESIFTTVDEVLINSNINLEKIYLLSIGTHGVVNPLTKIVTRSPFFKNWNGINLINIFKERYKKEVILEKYTDLAVVGEHWKSFNNLNNIIYLNIDYGIGAGIIINRKLIKGIKGTMGEISHLPILKNNNFKRLEQNKLELGLFESQVGIIGIVNKVKNEIKKSKKDSNIIIDKNIDNINFDDICKYYNAPNNNIVKKIIDNDIIKILAIGIVSIIALIDTEVIVIGGLITDLGEKFIDKLIKKIYCITPFKQEILVSKLKKDNSILGAIKYGIDYMDDIFYNRFLSILNK